MEVKNTFKELKYKLRWDQFVPFVATVVGIWTTDLLRGIAIGFSLVVLYIAS